MLVILTANVVNIGKIGEMVEVANGYAKNYLIPRKLAIHCNDNNKKIFEAKKKEFETENQKLIDHSQSIKGKLLGKNIVIIESASDDGRLYGSVSSIKIVNSISSLIKEDSIDRSAIRLRKPIKEIGVYEVEIAIHSESVFNILVVVTRSESETDQLLKAYRKNQNKDKSTSSSKDSDNTEENQIASE